MEYAGPPLRSGQRVEWRVRSLGRVTASRPIGAKPPGSRWACSTPPTGAPRGLGLFLVGSARASVPAPYLRKTFRLEKPPVRARLYITALGLYEASINGQRVGDAVLTPGWTDYRVRVRYQTYDVTALLQPGENALGAIPGDGWYCGHVEWRDRQLYGDRPKLLAQLVITDADGNETVIVSDLRGNTTFGPLTEADLLNGEHYDARREFPGWDAPGFDDLGLAAGRNLPPSRRAAPGRSKRAARQGA